MKVLVALSLFLLPTLAHSQIVIGQARVVDGDTLDIGGQRVRLLGIDAPESSQTCDRGGTAWACGSEATAVLARLVANNSVQCEQHDTDTYGRTVATCQVRGTDLGQGLVDAGMAITLSNAPEAYTESERRRRSLKIGLWGSTFDEPHVWRAAHPQLYRAPLQARQAPSGRSVRPSQGASSYTGQRVFFRSCGDAWRAGAAPLYRGQPGYRPEMDGDGDGIACEPFRGRR